MEPTENRIPSGGSYLKLNETNNATNIYKQIIYNLISLKSIKEITAGKASKRN
jgi:hypothetical protein